nr:hypothetical protein [Pedobacter sp. ASV19]
MDINSIADLIAAIDDNVKSPKNPPLKGSDLNPILKKMIELLNGSNGTYTVNDLGQTQILIPHGLGYIPGYWNVRGKNSNAKNIGISDESADATNIILTPIFTNNDGASLQYLWEANL